MIIHKIKFHNFMPYYRDVQFEFPIDHKKNVTIIYAPNDTGKSSLFEGIMFVFYGINQNKKLKDYINENSFKEKDFKAYVVIEGEHNGKILSIIRTILMKQDEEINPIDANFYDILDIYENGEKKHFDNFQEQYFDFINAIVHKEVSKYFFFDGEKINTFHIASGSDNKDAIKRILGLKEVEHAQNDFNKIKSEYEKDRDRILEDKTIATNILADKKCMEVGMKNFNSKIRSLECKIKKVKKQNDIYEEQLKKSKELEDLINNKQKIIKHRDELEKIIKEIEIKKKELFKNNAAQILGGIIFDKINRDRKTQDNKEIKTRLNPNVKMFLEDLLKKQTCVCGNVMNKKQIKEINKYISENSIDDLEYYKQYEKQEAFTELSKYLGDMSKAYFQYYIVYSELIKNKEKFSIINAQVNNLENEICDFIKNNEIEGFDEDLVEKLLINIDDNKRKKYEMEAQIKILNKNISSIEKELSKKEKKLGEFANADKKATIVERKLRLADKISKICNEYLEKLTLYKKQEVQDNAAKIFRELTNKPNRYKGLIITGNYSFKIQLMDGTTQEILEDAPKNPSTGQRKIIGLSYIAAINKSSNSVAPIIIDNPLGLFSEEHRKKVVNYLPRFGKQVIFMVTRADLSEEYRQIIMPYVNCEYDLEDITKTTWPKTKVKNKVVY
ncbi:AAA family ATPase [Clostridium kluyveri]|uniref:AAA family ATPase n=1 Tax=Clostridium kluyveri TaxID=1534 RepID=UPI002246904E|nr:AAA family ATPase [Clostridium kluyveri]UZQ50934.1 AAA family ATPase [Clostridium kluyveri]